jgi:hypothetical protein
MLAAFSYWNTYSGDFLSSSSVSSTVASSERSSPETGNRNFKSGCWSVPDILQPRHSPQASSPSVRSLAGVSSNSDGPWSAAAAPATRSHSAARANASAAVHLPTPWGPWNRYAFA